MSVDTIAAVATPAGRSALGLIRISGPTTFELLRRVFTPRSSCSFPAARTAFPGWLHDATTGERLDQVVVTTWISPASFTGEDLAEISTHGNPVILSSVLASLLQAGARPAEPGEFIRRAFLHGKLDLLEVEATAQVLSATSAAQAKIALAQLEGLPSQRIKALRDKLLDHLTQLEAGLSFPEDAIEDIDESALLADCDRIRPELDHLLVLARQGDLVAAGLPTALIGRPNTGKSSLLNALLGRDRAIVTEVAGTTRDTLEERWQAGPFPIKLIDTAGLRSPGDKVEAIGIERTRAAIKEAFLLVVVLDASEPIADEDREVLDLATAAEKPLLVVVNKADLNGSAGGPGGESDLRTRLGLGDGLPQPIIALSSKTGEGLDQLRDAIIDLIHRQGLESLDELIFLGARQTAALVEARAAIDRVRAGIGTIFQDMLAVELTEAVRQLGLVTGDNLDEHTLDRLFERFCIGK